MSVTLLIWACQLLLCSLAGFIVLRAAGARSATLTTAVFTGLAVLGTISSWLSIFINISLASNILVWLICAAYMYADRAFLGKVAGEILSSIKTSHPLIIISSSVIVLIILAETSFYLPKNYDTALYHAQAIRWIESFPAVPGLGNLHMRFAYGSGWFPLSAFFSLKYLSGISFHCLNGFILAAFSLYFMTGAGSVISGERKISSWLKLLLLPFSIAMYLNFSSSPGTDTPATVLIWAISALFLEYIENGNKDYVLPLIVMCAFAVTVKLAAIPIAFICLYPVIKSYAAGDKKTSLLYCLAFTAVLLPWLIRNYITSGYLVYPVAITGFIPSDWKMPAAILASDTGSIRQWSFVKPHDMPVLKYLFEWTMSLKTAFKAVFFPAVWVSIISAIYLLFYFIKNEGYNRLKGILFNPALIVLYSAAAGIVFLFLSAPDFRYGASFFLLLPLFISAKALSVYFREKKATTTILTFMILLCVFTPVYEIFLYGRYFFTTRDTMYIPEKPGVIAGRLIMPAQYFNADGGGIPHNDIKGIIIYTPAVKDRCWYGPFPSVPEIRAGLYLRGGSPAEGFAISNSQ